MPRTSRRRENRAKSFGKIGAAFGLGFICGPMLGGLLGEIDLTLPFYVAAAPVGRQLVYGYFFVPESLPRRRARAVRMGALNPFAALLRLVRRQRHPRPGRRVRAGHLAQMMLQSTWVLYTTFRFDWTTARERHRPVLRGPGRPWWCRPGCWAC